MRGGNDLGMEVRANPLDQHPLRPDDRQTFGVEQQFGSLPEPQVEALLSEPVGQARSQGRDDIPIARGHFLRHSPARAEHAQQTDQIVNEQPCRLRKPDNRRNEATHPKALWAASYQLIRPGIDRWLSATISPKESSITMLSIESDSRPIVLSVSPVLA